MSVTEEGDGEVQGALTVSLAEELLHDILAPDSAHSPRAAGVADVSTLEGNLSEMGGGGGDGACGVCVCIYCMCCVHEIMRCVCVCTYVHEGMWCVMCVYVLCT